MRRTDIILAVLVPCLWGMGLVFAKAALEYFPPILLVAFRFAVTALVFIWFIRFPRKQLLPLLSIALVSVVIQYSLTFTGLKYLDTATTVIVIQLEVPILVALGAILLREPLGLRAATGIGVAFIGVAFIAGQPELNGQYVPLMMVFVGVVCWALGQIMVRKLKGVNGLRLVTCVALISAPQLFFASFLFESDQILLIKEANGVVWGAVIYLGVIMTGCGYGLWYYLVGKYPVTAVSPYLLLVPVTSIAGGIVFLGEVPNISTLIGGAIVLLGMLLVVMGSQVGRLSAAVGGYFRRELPGRGSQ